MTETKKLPLWAALTSYLLGGLWICCLFGYPWTHQGEEYTLLIFACAFFPWASCCMNSKTHHPEHWFWMLCTFAIGVAIACKRMHAVDAWGYLAMHGFAAYWVVCYSGMLIGKETSAFFPLDGLETLVLAPFGGFFLRIITILQAITAGFRKLLRRENSRKNLLVSLAILAAAFPLLLVVGNLLGQADRAFADLTNAFLNLFRWKQELPLWLTNCFFYLLFGLPVGAYLCGLIGSCLKQGASRFSAPTITQSLEHLRIAPMGTLCTALGAFLALYLLFFGVQASHLLGAFFGNVPGTLTAAQYAREGFFQLCTVMGINFLLLALSAKLGIIGMREHKGLRLCGYALMVESLFLAITAASKLILYIHRFGFTPLRLLSFWGILVLSAGCLLAICSLRKPCNAVQKLVWFAAATFTLLCFF